MRAMFHPIHVCTHGDLCVYVCDQDCRVRAMLYPFHASTSGDLSLSLSASAACVLCSTQFTLAPLGISFYVCVHARAFGCLACLFLLTYEGASNDTRQAHQVCCERRVEITHSNPQRLVQPARLVACTLAGIVRRLLRLPCSVISRAPAAQPDGALLEREQGASAGRSGQGRKTARQVGEVRDEAAEAQQEQEQEQSPRAGLRGHHAEGLHARKQRRPASGPKPLAAEQSLFAGGHHFRKREHATSPPDAQASAARDAACASRTTAAVHALQSSKSIPLTRRSVRE